MDSINNANSRSQQLALVAQQPLTIVSNDNNNNSPPYAQLIIDAIVALRDLRGTSRQAINRHIQRVFTGELPSNHERLLTKCLQRMRAEGSIIMIRRSYSLAGSVPVSVPLTDSNRRPGLHSKTKTPHGQTIVSFGSKSHGGESQSQSNAKNMLVSVGVVEGPSAAQRGRGRPPKALGSSSKMAMVPGGKPKGRVPKALARSQKKVAAPGGVIVKKPGKLLGRPKKNALVLATHEDLQHSEAYQNLRTNILYFQSRVIQAIHVVKPYFTCTSAPIVYRELLELEELASRDMISPNTSSTLTASE